VSPLTLTTQSILIGLFSSKISPNFGESSQKHSCIKLFKVSLN
jgi:hypothetical protein